MRDRRVSERNELDVDERVERSMIDRIDALLIVADVVEEVALFIADGRVICTISAEIVERVAASLGRAYESARDRLQAPPGVPLDMKPDPAIARLLDLIGSDRDLADPHYRSLHYPESGGSDARHFEQTRATS